MNKVLDDAIEKIRQNHKPLNHQQHKYECEICKDTEFIIYEKNGYEMAKPCKCRELKQARRRMLKSGIDEEDLKKGFKDFQTFGEKQLEKAKNTAIEYYKAFDDVKNTRRNSILLSGASGRGKTMLGISIANNLLKTKNTAVLYMPYREEVTNLKQIITDETQYNDRMNRLKNSKVLFIDDLLKGKISESDLNIVYEIVNHRYLAKLPMIISTEKSPYELLKFDEAVGGRIIEMCKSYTVTIDSNVKNYRLR
jgi:DNA replication protein DnaC